jgi:site-specific DNA-methyltransferase (adenine-specific)
MRYTLHQGNCLAVMKTMINDGMKVHSVVTDPPYHLQSIVSRFGKEGSAPAANGVYRRSSTGFMGKEWDGGDIAFNKEVWELCHELLYPGGHLLAFSATRNYHRMTCAIEDAGFEIRDQIGWLYGTGFPKSHSMKKQLEKLGEIEASKDWEAWGTALKPAWEPICVARKALDESSIARNVLKYGTGALNIDDCRIGTDSRTFLSKGIASGSHNLVGSKLNYNQGVKTVIGRWPANVIHDGSEEVIDAFPSTYGDEGSAARFFYCAKATEEDRAGSKHPTIKPIKLMRYLTRLITPKGGIVLDPFAGSGTTLQASVLEGFRPIGIELDPQYIQDIERRMRFMPATLEGL